ncbi:ATP-grasp domain-containing protein [Eudoraea chungangensis]|uniref:ATP-grasp domain-containing protein n=1 Tax=Eudoraea chungangensis TaxID=1481905 RepID=UPI0023EAC7CF|nr:ATP-grasp domain-containing protein [Eudoraea chungangensis]
MNILITSIGRRVSLLKAFQKELKLLFPSGKVFGADARPNLSAACLVADGYFRVPFVEEEDYISILIEKCLEEEIKMIIPTIDTELLLLAKNKKLFLEVGIKVVISSLEFVSVCRDKREVHKFFKNRDIPVAKEFDKNNYDLPLFIKPIDGSRSIDNFIVKKEEELKDAYFQNKKLMFLEYLDHDVYDEFTCDLYYNQDNQLKCVVPRKRISVRDGEVNKGLTVFNELIPFLRERLSVIDGAVGCLTLQLFRHKANKNVFGIEINPRFGGGYPLSYLAGANFPKWILQEYLLDLAIEDQFEIWEKDLLMIRYDDEVLVHGYKSK